MVSPAMLRRVLPLLLLAACAQSTDDDGASTADLTAEDRESLLPPPPEAAVGDLPAEPDDAVSRLPWQELGLGVHYKSFGSGHNVVIIYGGYTAEDDWVERWSDQIYRTKGAQLDIAHLYAVRGPNTAGYTNHEIQNSHLVAHLVDSGRAANAPAIIVVAHSSGTYVANELFSMVKNGASGIPTATTEAKVRLFNLDGGGPPADIKNFARAYFVYSCDRNSGKCSHNSDGMKSLGQSYASLGGALEVNATGSLCDGTVIPGGLWCLHDTLINTRPHNHVMYDLKWDYGDFTSPRALVTSYLEAPL
jgi:hypothetical protein